MGFRILGFAVVLSVLMLAPAVAEETALQSVDLQPVSAAAMGGLRADEGGSPVAGTVLYAAVVETGYRFNPGTAAPGDSLRVAFDDVPIPNGRLNGATEAAISLVRVGIRQAAPAPAATVTVYWATATTGPVAPDTELDSPGTAICSFDLPASSTSVTQVLTCGDGVNPIPGMESVRLNTTLFPGYSTFLVGVRLSSTDPNVGWRVTSGADANQDVFWLYDPLMSGQPNPEASLNFGGSPVARFFLRVEGTPLTASVGGHDDTAEAAFLGTPHANPGRGPIEFSVNSPGKSPVRVQILDVTGRVVETSFEGVLEPGLHYFSWNPDRGVPSGIYFLHARADAMQETRRLVLVR
jgi:hypothetical protein